LQKNNNISLFEGKIVCPRCDGNGLIYKGKITGLDTIIYICDECEAAWDEISNISLDTFSDLTLFLEKKGCPNEDVIDLGYVMV
jgi:hypothetical protein